MSLRVNLILETEQRSGSRLDVKSVLRIASIILPTLLGIIIALQALGSFMLNSQVNILESRWSAVMPKQKQALKLASRLNFNLKTKAELDAWAAARPPWNQVLAAIMETVPDAIQLTSLNVSLADTPVKTDNANKTPTEASPPVRTYRLLLDGKTAVADSMVEVQLMEKNVLAHPIMAPLLDTVKVSNFAADTISSNQFSRVFTIQCMFKTLPFKETR